MWFATAWPCVAAGPGEATVGALGPEWVAVAPERLERTRGGFQLPSGLALSFGIERVVHVNGTLVASASVHIPDVARMTAAQARDLAEMNRGLLVQVGEGNAFTPSTAINGVVIQNTLGGQEVRALTTLDVGVGTLGMFQQLNANAALQDALNTAAGAP
ncbi:PASTA domain-containing protein [Novilysobacter erysipheiresistens]|uniref:PASTA domain-containing protein n=1 Tax=Novilysobacter erysipheiresistens TaxID=1749332 RepID=A0ABU7Z0C2_9GAMM